MSIAMKSKSTLIGVIFVLFPSVACADLIIWTGDGDGADWHDPVNWDRGRIPAPGDSVVIPDLPGDVIVSHFAGDTTIDSLVCLETLIVFGEQLTIEMSTRIIGGLILDGGAFRNNGPTFEISGQLQWLEGILTGEGALRLSGLLEIAGDNRQKRLQGNLRIENAGTIIWSAAGQMSNSGTAGFDNLAGGLFEIRSDGFQTISGGGPFNNFGTVVRSAGTSTATFSIRFNNHGVVVSETGWLTFTRRGTHTGSFSATPIGDFQFTGGLKTFETSSSISASRVHLDGNMEFHGRLDITDATVFRGSSATVTFGENAELISFGVLDVREGFVNFETGQSIDFNNAHISGGVLSGSDVITFNGRLTLSGRLGGSSTYFVRGPFAWLPAGTMFQDATVWLLNEVEISGPGARRIRDRCVVNNVGTMAWTGGGFTSDDEAVFNNLAGATIVASGTDLTWLASGSPTFNNDGTIESDSPGGGVQIWPQMNNNGAIHVRSGSFELHRGSTSGALTGDSGSTIILKDWHTFQASSIVAGDNLTVDAIDCFGAFSFTGAVRFVEGDVHFHPGSSVSLGEVTLEPDFSDEVQFNSGTPIELTSLELHAGVISGSDTITVNGPMLWRHGGIGGTLNVFAAGGLLIDGGFARGLGQAAILHNLGQANWVGGRSLFVNTQAMIHNHPNASFLVDFDAPEIDGGGTFLNEGEFLRSAGSGLMEIDVAVENDGSFRIESGEIVFFMRFQSRGSLVGAPGTTVTFGHEVLFEPESSIDVETVVFSPDRAPVVFHGGYRATRQTQIRRGVLDFEPGARIHELGDLIIGARDEPIVSFNTGEPVNAANYTHLQGTLGGSDTLTVSGRLTWQGGGMVDDGTVILDDGILLSSDFALPKNRTLVWRGGDINADSGTEFTVDPGATLLIENHREWNGGLITNRGLFAKTSAGGTTTITSEFFNRASLDVRAGTMSFSNNYVQTTGMTRVFEDARLAAPLVEIRRGGALVGRGVIDGSVMNQARLEPGPGIGTLHITGDYTQSGGRVQLEIGGRNEDQLDHVVIDGRAQLDGTLALALLDSFEPDDNDLLTVLTAGSVVGRFRRVTGPCLARGRHLGAAYTEDSVAVVVSPPILGDVNCDCMINAFDIEPFLVALFEPGEYAGRYPDCDINLADINGDGSINAFDIEPFIVLLFGP